MDEFKKWLDEEIEKIKDTQNESNMFVHGKLSEATRIRAMYLQMTGGKGNEHDNR